MDSGENGVEAISQGLPPGAAKVLSAAAAGAAPGIRDTSADIWGALIGDRVKQWRTRNFIDGLEKTAAHIEGKGVNLSEASSLPYGDMLVLFDGMSKEDDTDLSDMWSRLLASAMSENEVPEVSSRSVAAVLSQISPEAARLFLFLAKIYRSEWLDKKIQRLQTKEFFPLDKEEKYLDESKLTDERGEVEREIEGIWKGVGTDVQISISKSELLRLNLIQPKETFINFDYKPFGRGVNVNASGLDSVISELVQNTKELIDSRTLSNARTFFEPGPSRRVNFELSAAGVEIAKKLSLC